MAKQGLLTFEMWLVNFLDSDEVDPAALVMSGNDKEITLKDVIVKIIHAKPSEQYEIKAQLIEFRKKGGNAKELLKVYAKAITVTG